MDADVFWFGALWAAVAMALALLWAAVMVGSSDIEEGIRGVRDDWRERQD